MKPTSSKGFTWVEVLIALVVAIILVLLATPFLQSLLLRGRLAQTLHNIQALQLVTEQMTVDNQTTGNPVRWTCSDKTPLSLDQWRKLLVPAYVQEKDLNMLLSTVGKKGTEDAITVFAVCDSDTLGTVFFATKNWRGVGTTNLLDAPFGKQWFVVMRKGGDGAIYPARDATNTNLIGSGGQHDFLPLK